MMCKFLLSKVTVFILIIFILCSNKSSAITFDELKGMLEQRYSSIQNISLLCKFTLKNEDIQSSTKVNYIDPFKKIILLHIQNYSITLKSPMIYEEMYCIRNFYDANMNPIDAPELNYDYVHDIAVYDSQHTYSWTSKTNQGKIETGLSNIIKSRVPNIRNWLDSFNHFTVLDFFNFIEVNNMKRMITITYDEESKYILLRLKNSEDNKIYNELYLNVTNYLSVDKAVFYANGTKQYEYIVDSWYDNNILNIPKTGRYIYYDHFSELKMEVIDYKINDTVQEDELYNMDFIPKSASVLNTIENEIYTFDDTGKIVHSRDFVTKNLKNNNSVSLPKKQSLQLEEQPTFFNDIFDYSLNDIYSIFDKINID